VRRFSLFFFLPLSFLIRTVTVLDDLSYDDTNYLFLLPFSSEEEKLSFFFSLSLGVASCFAFSSEHDVGFLFSQWSLSEGTFSFSS